MICHKCSTETAFTKKLKTISYSDYYATLIISKTQRQGEIPAAICFLLLNYPHFMFQTEFA